MFCSGRFLYNIISFMILQSELYPIGRVQKTHGIKGELSIILTSEFDTLDFNYFVFEMDGILVPFFIQEWRFRTAETALVKFERVNDDLAGKEFVGKTIYIPKDFMSAIPPNGSSNLPSVALLSEIASALTVKSRRR